MLQVGRVTSERFVSAVHLYNHTGFLTCVSMHALSTVSKSGNFNRSEGKSALRPTKVLGLSTVRQRVGYQVSRQKRVGELRAGRDQVGREVSRAVPVSSLRTSPVQFGCNRKRESSKCAGLAVSLN